MAAGETRILQAVLTGDSASMVAAFVDSANAAEESAEDISAAFEDAAASTDESMAAIAEGATAAAGVVDAAAGDITAATAGMDVDEDSGGLLASLREIPAPALAAAAAIAAITVEAFKMGEEMQSADAQIAISSGSTIAAATNIGNAFLDTAGTSEFSGLTMAKAFATVAGELKSTEGHTLNVKEAMQFMNAAADLATAKQLSLGDATTNVAGIMQAFGIETSGAANVANILFNASNATGQSIDSLASSLEKMHAKLGEASPSLAQLTGLIVDLTNHGETGRAAISAVSSAMQHLMNISSGVTTAKANERTAFANLSPAVAKLADEYMSGAITGTAFTNAVDDLPQGQAAAANAFLSAADAVTTSKLKLEDLGITVDTSSGKFVGLASVITQLHDKTEGMTQSQALATVSQVFGAAAAQKLLTVVEAGPSVFDKTTAAVDKVSSAHHAAALEAATLDGMMKTLHATVDDLMIEYGQKLIPVVTEVAKVFLDLTVYLLDHKVVLLALMSAITFGMADIWLAAFELYTHWHEVWKDMTDVVDDAWHYMYGKVFEPIDHFFLDVFNGALHGLEKAWDATWNAIKGAVAAVWSFLEPIFNAIAKAIGGVVSGIGHISNAAHDIAHIGGGVVGDVEKAFKWLGTGGIIQQKGIYGLAESGPEAVIPLDKLGSSPGALSNFKMPASGFSSSRQVAANVTNIWHVDISGALTPQQIVDALRTYQERSGSIPIRIRA
jgi:Phage-related minor tail protein